MSFTNGQVVQATDLNNAETKCVSSGLGATGTFAGSTTVTAIAGTAVTVVVPAGGTVKVTIVVPDVVTGAAGFGILSTGVLRAGSVFSSIDCFYIDGASRQNQSVVILDAPGAGSFTYQLCRSTQLSAGSYTYGIIGPYMTVETYGAP